MQYFHSIFMLLAKLQVLACLIIDFYLLTTHVSTLDDYPCIFGA